MACAAVEIHKPGTDAARPWLRDSWTPGRFGPLLEKEIEKTRRLLAEPLTDDTHIEPWPLALPPMTLTFKDVSFTATLPDKTKKTILEPVSGHWEGGKIVAIMGPSGCGKSTLLDILANKKTASYEGEILVNGHPRDRLFSRITSYVGQEDVMPQFWTVREAINFNQRLKSPQSPPEIQSSGVDLICEAFGLGTVLDTYIGGSEVRGCSGGQRRRVSLARGVVSRAPLLFCDEPTSGLSATDAETCVKALRILARRTNTLIVVVIHQPRAEVARLFDELLLLTSGPGRPVYSGPMASAAAYWESCGYPCPVHANPTDWFLDLCTPGAIMDKSQEFVDFFQTKQKTSIDALVEEKRKEVGLTAVDIIDKMAEILGQALGQQPHAHHRPHAASSGRQLCDLLRNKIRLTLRNKGRIVTTVLVPTIQGLLMGCMFHGVGHKSLPFRLPFIWIIYATLIMAALVTIPSLIEGRTIMKYDTSEALYSEHVFLLVELLVDVPLLLLGATSQVFIMYTLSGFDWEYFGVIYAHALMLFFVFHSVYGFISAMADTAQRAQTCAIPFNSIFMMFSGFMISPASAPSYLKWIFFISPNFYGFQSTVSAIAKDDPIGAKVMRDSDLHDGQDARGYTVMIAEILILRVLQVLALKYRNNIQR